MVDQHPAVAVLKEMATTLDEKANDYADEANLFSNFENSASFAGVTTGQAFDVMIGIKFERLRQLKAGKTPNFESERDTRLDMANYLVLSVSYEDMQREPAQ